MKSGIYKIENNINHKVYIGQSIDIRARFSQHKSALKKNKHENKHLQQAVNRYGINNFEFSIIELCPIENLDDREIMWIQHYNSANKKYGYNNDLGGKSNKIVSTDTRRKLREAFEGEKSNTVKISEETAKVIIDKLIKGESIHSIANNLNISHKIVEGIRSKRKWKHLTKGVTFPTKKSSVYKWVSKVPKANVVLYRAIVKVDGKKLYDKCWDNEYDAAVAREIFIRENNITGVTKNFNDSEVLVMPTKIKYSESKYYGVCKESGCNNRWVAQLHFKGKHYYIGVFDNEYDAAIAREKYIDENFPNEKLKRNLLNEKPERLQIAL